MYWGGGPLHLWEGSLFFKLRFGEGYFKNVPLREGL